MVYQKVGCVVQCWVGGDVGIFVGIVVLQFNCDFRNGNWFVGGFVGVFCDVFEGFQVVFDGVVGFVFLLDCYVLQSVVCVDFMVVDEFGDLYDFVVQIKQENFVEIGILGIVGKCVEECGIVFIFI